MMSKENDQLMEILGWIDKKISEILIGFLGEVEDYDNVRPFAQALNIRYYAADLPGWPLFRGARRAGIWLIDLNANMLTLYR